MEQNSEQHFMPCLNENCNTFHLVNTEELAKLGNNNNSIEILLCEICRSRKDHYHILQCMSCRTIIEFLPVLPGETPGIIYVEKCLRCGGTIEDEISFVSSLYKHVHF